jgi:hypothetical protein
MLRGMFGLRRGKVTREWRKLMISNEELNNMYTSPNNIRVMKSKGMELAGHVTRKGR